MPPEDPSTPAVRLDRWLWAARAFRSRSLAAQACSGGRISVNDNNAKPHKLVRPGDLIRIGKPRGTMSWRVRALSERRGGAAIAQTLYEDLTEPSPPTPQHHPASRPPHRERGQGRPTKRERRDIERLRSR
jgi:ribosome-associated heat shock protein Hsp15